MHTLGNDYQQIDVAMLSGFAPGHRTKEDYPQWIRLFYNIIDQFIYGCVELHMCYFSRGILTYSESRQSRVSIVLDASLSCKLIERRHRPRRVTRRNS